MQRIAHCSLGLVCCGNVGNDQTQFAIQLILKKDQVILAVIRNQVPTLKECCSRYEYSIIPVRLAS